MKNRCYQYVTPAVQLSRGSRPMLQIQQLAKAWQLTEEEEKPNPVTQRVKIIMVSFSSPFHGVLSVVQCSETVD